MPQRRSRYERYETERKNVSVMSERLAEHRRSKEVNRSSSKQSNFFYADVHVPAMRIALNVREIKNNSKYEARD